MEMIYVVKGFIYIGFVVIDNRFYDGVLEECYVVIFFYGFFYFFLNVGKGQVEVIVLFNSENFGF